MPIRDRTQQALQLDRLQSSERRPGNRRAAVGRETTHKDIFVDRRGLRKGVTTCHGRRLRINADGSAHASPGSVLALAVATLTVLQKRNER